MRFKEGLAGLVLGGTLVVASVEKVKADLTENAAKSSSINGVFYNPFFEEHVVQFGDFEQQDSIIDHPRFVYGIGNDEFDESTNIPPRIYEQFLAEYIWNTPNEPIRVGEVEIDALKPSNEGFLGDWLGVKFFETDEEVKIINFFYESTLQNGYSFQLIHNINGIDYKIWEQTGRTNKQYVFINLGENHSHNYMEFRLQNIIPEPSTPLLIGSGLGLAGMLSRRRKDGN